MSDKKQTIDIEAHFSLTVPCGGCPFRKDRAGAKLRKGRLEEILESLLSGENTSFTCHKTIDYSTAFDESLSEDERRSLDTERCCAGAAALCRKLGRDTVMVQIAERMGIIEPSHFDEAMEMTIDTKDVVLDESRIWLRNRSGQASE